MPRLLWEEGPALLGKDSWPPSLPCWSRASARAAQPPRVMPSRAAPEGEEWAGHLGSTPEHSAGVAQVWSSQHDSSSCANGHWCPTCSWSSCHWCPSLMSISIPTPESVSGEPSWVSCFLISVGMWFTTGNKKLACNDTLILIFLSKVLVNPSWLKMYYSFKTTQ